MPCKQVQGLELGCKRQLRQGAIERRPYRYRTKNRSWLCGSFTTAKPFVVEMALNEARVQDGQAQFRIGYTVDNTLFVTVDAASKKG